ncbi:MAG: Clo7bot family Cys-rich peptide [Paraclostridium bifermentans]|nr:Clo7bot family Cys-rich peptide [Paraclostridium bifermentans]MBS5953793.1 Clo7bot family Cys-rich peptide [Paraclostridium bifermentans]
MKFIKKPTKKFEEGYCFFSCDIKCDNHCSNNCTNYYSCGSNYSCISYNA